MNRQLILSSHSVKNKNGNKPGDFIIKYTNPIILNPNRQYELGLDRIVSMSFTWFNITSDLNNQKIRFSSDSGTNWTELIFNPGVWNYVDFNNFIKDETKTGTSSNPSFPIILEFDDTIFRTIITLAQNYQLDLTQSDFNDLIGFNKKILTQAENIGDHIPNLSQDREILNVHCDLISDSLVDGDGTDIIYSFSTSTLTPSFSFTQEPRRVQFNPVNKNTINTIRIYITDGKRRIVDLNHSDTSFSLILREKRD